VRAAIAASDSELFEAAVALLPAGAKLLGPGSATDRFMLLREDGRYHVSSPIERNQRCDDWELALDLLAAQLHLHVAIHARDQTFVHAGAVVHQGRAIVIPGPSLAGKTTLVAALIKAGALYFSDELAFLDQQGLVHPYPRPLAVRSEGDADVQWPVGRIGGVRGAEPAPIGVLAITTYRPGAEWKPEPRSHGRGVMALLSNAPAATERPAEVLAVTHRAVAPALVVESERGEAGAVAASLLAIAETGTID
jgi:hypothetical protein